MDRALYASHGAGHEPESTRTQSASSSHDDLRNFSRVHKPSILRRDPDRLTHSPALTASTLRKPRRMKVPAIRASTADATRVSAIGSRAHLRSRSRDHSQESRYQPIAMHLSCLSSVLGYQ
jgi:hypothetical protein